MLTHIHIQNYILVKNLSIDFEKGLNILTGETGAGKSLWMDAVLIALGAKADASVIRHDADTCSITVTFDISHNAAATAYLQEHDFAQDGLCIIRRILYKNKAGKTNLNDHPCTLQNLKNLAPLLLSIHGQHHHQSLLQTDAHRKMLDSYADNLDVLNQIDSLVSKYHHNQKNIDQLTQKSHTQNDEMAILQFHYKEIKALHLEAHTWQMINEKHQTLHHTQSLIDNMTLAEKLLQSDKQSMIDQIEQVQKYVNKALGFDKKLEAIATILNEAHINISEAVSEIHHYCNQLDTDPKSLETIENQLSAIHTLARKHRIEPSSLMSFQNELEKKMNNLENLDARLHELESEQKKLQEQYQTLAEQLSTKRNKASRKLEALLTADMQMLGMEGGVFCIATDKHDQGIHRYGQEHIIFKVSTNPGQPIKPLQDIVSGGELSRLSLALHRHLAEKNQQPTLIFDEVDTGIGGTTADKVGALLKDLSKRYQILCITHLPHIASLADQHFKAQKQSTKDDTQTMIVLLNRQERIEELSRMLGGTHITQSIKDHAEHLLNG